MTINELRKILNAAGVEYIIKKQKGCIAKINVLVDDKEEEYNVTNG